MIKGEIKNKKYMQEEKLYHKLINISLSLTYFFCTYYFGQTLVTYINKQFDNPLIRQSVIIDIFQISAALLAVSTFSFLYYNRFPFIEQFKCNSRQWPWLEDKAKFKQDCIKGVSLYLFNGFLINPIFFFFLYRVTKMNSDMETYPSFMKHLFQTITIIFGEDFFFYFGHRLLHTPLFYKRFHKKHHEYYDTVFYSVLYSHPIDFAFFNILPFWIPVMMWNGNIHAITIASYIAWNLMESHETHSGYQFPISVFNIFPFSTDSDYHNHHHLKNTGNYSSFLQIWDTYFGTNRHYYAEKNKHTS